MGPLPEMIIKLDWRYNFNNCIPTISLFWLWTAAINIIIPHQIQTWLYFSEQRGNTWAPLDLVSNSQIQEKQQWLRVFFFFFLLLPEQSLKVILVKNQLIPHCQCGNKSAKDGLNRTAKENTTCNCYFHPTRTQSSTRWGSIQ